MSKASDSEDVGVSVRSETLYTFSRSKIIEILSKHLVEQGYKIPANADAAIYAPPKYEDRSDLGELLYAVKLNFRKTR